MPPPKNVYREVKKCLFCLTQNLEIIADFGRFPIFCGPALRKDIYQFYPFRIAICLHCGLIQQENLINPEILYADFKNESVGKTWEIHNELLFGFIERELNPNQKKIIEVGTGSGKIIDYFSDKFNIILCDPNLPQKRFGRHIKIKKIFFENYETNQKFDLIFASHVFEHLTAPIDFLKKSRNLLAIDGEIIISLPNFKAWIKNGYLNAFSQEHSIYPTDQVLDDFFFRCGFKILRKKLYKDHSVFYSLAPFSFFSISNLGNMSKNAKTRLINWGKNLVLTYIKRLNNLRNHYHRKLGDRKYYIFGAHIFAQMLLFYCGLPIRNCLGFLDNAKTKQNKYLYGTFLKCYSPLRLNKEKRPTVIINAGTYTKEIVNQLKMINSDTNIL